MTTRQNGDITGDKSGDNTLRVPVIKAAELLGLSEGAVRQRIKRGTLPVEKAADGSVYVLLEDASGMRTNGDNTRTNNDYTHDKTADLRMTVERLDSEVNFLRSELITRNEELRRKDHIIAALADRVPELEPAQGAPPGPSPSSPEQQVPWWKRFFGFE